MGKLSLKTYFLDLQKKGAFKGVEFEKLSNEQNAELLTGFLDKISESLATCKSAIEKGDGNNEALEKELKTLNDAHIKSQDRIIAIYSDLYKVQKEKGLKLKKEVEANYENGQATQEDIKKVADFVKIIKNKDYGELVLKATTVRSSVANSTLAKRSDRVSELAHLNLTLFELFGNEPIGRFDGASFRFIEVDSASTVRAAASTAETGDYAESTINYVENSIELKTVTDSLKYSYQFEFDFSRLMGYLNTFLNQNILLEKNDKIVNGTGVGEDWQGMNLIIPTYTPVASGVQDPNIYDLFDIMATSIEGPKGSKYTIDFIALSPSDMSKYITLKKDGENDYLPLMRKFSERGVKVVKNQDIADGTMFIGDSRYGYVLDDGEVITETLRPSSDKINGVRALAIMIRGNFLIRNEEREGFLKVIDIDTALTTIGA